MGLFGLGRANPAHVLRSGTSHRGHIIGIRVSRTRDDPPARVDEYAICVSGPGGMQIYGVRQRLIPDDPVRLGLPVQLRVDGKAAFIDWVATCGSLGAAGENVVEGWKALKEAPHEGVVDGCLDLDKAQRKGEPVRVAIEAIGPRRQERSLTSVMDLDLVLRQGNGTTPAPSPIRQRVEVPFYARHVCEQGSELPAYLRYKPEQIDIDWPTAARNFMAIEAARRG